MDIDMTCQIRKVITDGVLAEAHGIIAKAKANVEVYLHNSAGIGEHSDILAAINEQLDIIASAEERISVLNKYFSN